MIVGDPALFAIESKISAAYNQPSLRALGYFALHNRGIRYGVVEPDATMLACSFDAVCERCTRRGKHIADFASDFLADDIASLFRAAVYGTHDRDFFPGAVFQHAFDTFAIDSNKVIWAPDGDAAFDDGSYVLQFDLNDQVRIIAFRCGKNGLHDPTTLTDTWIPSEEFYGLLRDWCHKFHLEWQSLPKQ